MRQRDVIGEWEPIPQSGATSAYVLNGRQWVSGLTWADISESWILTKRTTKTGRVVTHDLTLCPMAFGLLQETPPERRYGPVILDEMAGRPYAEHAYQREWRRLANSAGLPRGVWNMDARAGGVTEGNEAGASLGDLRPAVGHSDERTTSRYARGEGLEQSRRVAQLRIAHRTGK